MNYYERNHKNTSVIKDVSWMIVPLVIFKSLVEDISFVNIYSHK